MARLGLMRPRGVRWGVRLLGILILAVCLAACGRAPTGGKGDEVKGQVAAATAADPRALEIIRQSEQAYLDLKTYTDDIMIAADGRELRPRTGFARTAFERGGSFLIEVAAKDPYGDGMARDRVWIEEGTEFIQTALGGRVSSEKPLQEGLRTISASSAETSLIVPTLLFAEKFHGDTFFDRLKTPSLGEEMVLGGNRHYKITDSTGVTVLIDVETLLIRRVLLGGGKGMLDYTAYADAPIGPESFRRQ